MIIDKLEILKFLWYTGDHQKIVIVWIGRLFRSRSLDGTLLTLLLTIIVPVHMEYIPNKSCKHSLCFVIPLKQSWALGFTMSVLSVHDPLCPLCSTYTSGWIFFSHLAQMISNMRGGCLACNDFWPWYTRISSRSFSLDLATKTVEILHILSCLLCNIGSSGSHLRWLLASKRGCFLYNDYSPC